jgi:hypothetical protein
MPDRFTFSDLRELFAKANEEKPGDRLAGIAVGSERERIGCKVQARRLSLNEIVRTPLIDPDDDDVSGLISETVSATFGFITATARNRNPYLVYRSEFNGQYRSDERAANREILSQSNMDAFSRSTRRCANQKFASANCTCFSSSRSLGAILSYRTERLSAIHL